MILSRASVELISAASLNGNSQCNCPSASTPDDMWLGACAQSLNIPTVHFSGFHQVKITIIMIVAFQWHVSVVVFQRHDGHQFWPWQTYSLYLSLSLLRLARKIIHRPCSIRSTLFHFISTGWSTRYKSTANGSPMILTMTVLQSMMQ